MKKHRKTLRTRWMLVFAFALTATSNVSAVTRIGVLDLNDDRQHPNLSLLDPAMSAANATLVAEGFEIAAVPSLSAVVLENVDILWLPLLDAPSPGLNPAYTFDEMVQIVAFLEGGGRVLWVGDAGVFNPGDQTFLDSFGIEKLTGNYDTSGPVVAAARHAIVTGPNGPVTSVAAAATFGLMDTSNANIAVQDILADAVGPGAFLSVASIPNAIGPDGRLAMICDASIFEQFFNDGDHQALMLNIVRWLEAAPGYTPSAPAATPVTVDDLVDACDACSTTTLTFADVAVTGESIAAPLGAGRCDVGGIPDAALPTDFLGYAISIATTAAIDANPSTTVTIQYDRTALQAFGIDATAEQNLRLYNYDATGPSTTDLSAVLDTNAQSISAVMPAPGILLFGASAVPTDCNNNGTPDDCELDGNDCNNNGILDACEISIDSTAAGDFYCTENCDPDCNDNGIPDDCDAAVTITFAIDPPNSGTVQPAMPQTFDVCTPANILATPADGYCFGGWSADVGPTPVPANNASASITAVSNQTITANFIPVITQQPAPVAVCDGELATFSVEIDDSLMADATYQWRRDQTPIDGATNAEYELTSATVTDVASYDVVITTICGVVTSQPVTLTIVEPPTITSTVENIQACKNATVQFTVDVNGTGPFNTQWTRDGADIPGQTGSAMTLTNIQAASAGVIGVRVANDCGVDEADIAVFTVLQPPTVVTPPAAVIACPGDDVNLAVDVTGAEPMTIEWIKDGVVVPGAAGAVLTLENVAAANAGQYQARITNQCGTTVSAAAAVTVDTLPQIIVQPVSKTACPGDVITFQVSAVGTERTHRWRFRPTGGGAFTDVQPSVDISGQDTFRLLLANVIPQMAGTYQCIVATDCDPVGIVSENVELTVNAPPMVTEHPESQTACAGQSVILRAGPIDPNYQYNWVFNGQAISISNPAYAGVDTPELEVLNVSPALVGNYSCRIIGLCSPIAFSEVATLSISSGVCDCNGNGVDDAEDITSGFSDDCNNNGKPDECDIAIDSPAPDGPFFCTAGCALDCDDNGLPDSCDIANGADDCNNDGIPDACQLAGGDCNADGILDACQLAGDDCNHNGILDSCEPPFVADAGEDFFLCAGRPSNALGGPVVASGSIPGYTYLWSIVAGPTDGGQLTNPTAERAQFVATIPGVYTIQLRVTDSTGCVTTDEVEADIYEMSVNAGPDMTVCATTTDIQLSGSIEGGIDPLLYQWSIEPGSASLDPMQIGGDGPTALEPTFSPASPGVYFLKLTITDANDRACILYDTVKITAAIMRLEGSANFVMCNGGTSAPLDVLVASGGTAPFMYEWTIDAGSADTNPLQFGGTGPHSRTPTFTPNIAGVYSMTATVTDSSNPPCVGVHLLTVSVTSLEVVAGNDAAICLDTGGIQLSPTFSGGAAPLFFNWSIEPGSPSQSNLQFQNQTGLQPNWIFNPTAVGAYTLKLTVTDSATPPCTATDTLVVRASRLNVDAGPDLVVRAFEPSPALGALPVVVGATGEVNYDWRVIAGPSLDKKQFSNDKTARPVFTPSMIGRYAVELTAAAVDGCARSDQIVVDAIIDKHAMPVNAQGRAYYELRIDAPHTRADVRFHETQIGLETSAEIVQPGDADPFARRVIVTAEPSNKAIVLMVAIYLDTNELAALAEGSTVLRWIESQNIWRNAADRDMESAFYPARPTIADKGRQGYDAERGVFWAITDVVGTFTLGTPGSAAPPVVKTDDPPVGNQPPDVMTPMCGMGGAAGMLIMPTIFFVWVGRLRSRRSRWRLGSDRRKTSLDESVA